VPTRIEKEPPSHFPSVTLYQSDLRDIIAIIQEATGEAIGISDEEYRYD